MESINLIRENLERSAERVLLRVEEMRAHATVPPTPRGGAHTLWVLGHLAYIEGLVVRKFMLGEENPLAPWEATFDGDAIAADAATFPPFDEVLATCRRMRAETIALLATMGEADMDRPAAAAPAGTDAMFGTRRRCFQFVADHWYMHRGQLADARRAAGVGRMWF